MNLHYDAHGFRGNPNILEYLLGRPAARFHDYVIMVHHHEHSAAARQQHRDGHLAHFAAHKNRIVTQSREKWCQSNHRIDAPILCYHQPPIKLAPL